MRKDKKQHECHIHGTTKYPAVIKKTSKSANVTFKQNRQNKQNMDIGMNMNMNILKTSHKIDTNMNTDVFNVCHDIKRTHSRG